jgi:hypothetical protein
LGKVLNLLSTGAIRWQFGKAFIGFERRKLYFFGQQFEAWNFSLLTCVFKVPV